MPLRCFALLCLLACRAAELGVPSSGDPEQLLFGSSPDWTTHCNQASCFLGSPVNAGDVNGDGYSDLLIGAPGHMKSFFLEGRAQVFFGGPDGPASLPDWYTDGGGRSVGLGPIVDAGDVNGDGYHDVLVGADGAVEGEAGQLALFYGSAAGLESVAGWSYWSEQGTWGIGDAVGAPGDVNGDGYADLLASGYDLSGDPIVRVALWLGSAAGPSPLPAWSFEAPGLLSSPSGLTIKLDGADVNGDGFDDLILGYSFYENGEPQEGTASVFHGGPDGPSTVAAWQVESNVADSWYGQFVSSAGDVNGDGYEDVIVGAPEYDGGATHSGAAFLYLGSPTGLAAAPAWVGSNATYESGYGSGVRSAGDLNGDGFADVVVGADDFDNYAGRVYAYLGGPEGLSAEPAWSAAVAQEDSQFGTHLTGAGDVDGDGLDDILVGAHVFDDGEEDEGAAFLFLAPCGGAPDDDGDGLRNSCDGCDRGPNIDSDGDHLYDACDPCVNAVEEADADADGICDADDRCPGADDAADLDADGEPDACDPCPSAAADDSDGDGVCDDADRCPGLDDRVDVDEDGVPDGCDPDVTDASGAAPPSAEAGCGCAAPARQPPSLLVVLGAGALGRARARGRRVAQGRTGTR